MYTVSQSYKDAMHAMNQHRKVFGYIDNVPFDNNDVLEGSMSVNNKCSGSEVSIGYAGIGELNITFLDVDIPVNTWYGRAIYPSCSLLVDEQEDIWEDVPIGIFTIDSAQRTSSGTVIKAFDNMSKLTKSCVMRFTNAKPYDMLSYMCTECGVELGNTQEEIEEMPNGNEILSQYPESDIETWQDMVWLSGHFGAGKKIF